MYMGSVSPMHRRHRNEHAVSACWWIGHQQTAYQRYSFDNVGLLRKFFVPYGETDVKPTLRGIAMRLRGWEKMKKIIDLINNAWRHQQCADVSQVSLGTALPYYLANDHLNHLGALQCTEWYPFSTIAYWRDVHMALRDIKRHYVRVCEICEIKDSCCFFLEKTCLHWRLHTYACTYASLSPVSLLKLRTILHISTPLLQKIHKYLQW